MSNEPTAEEYQLAARHSDAASHVRSIEYQMRLVRLECAQRLAPLEAQLQVARASLNALQPQYDAMMERLEEEEQATYA